MKDKLILEEAKKEFLLLSPEDKAKTAESFAKIKNILTPHLIRMFEEFLDDEDDCCGFLSEIEALIPEENKSIKMEDVGKEVPILTQIWWVIENAFYK